MSDSHKFAEKIKQLEQQGKQLLDGTTSQSGAALPHTTPVANAVKQAIAHDDMLTRGRLEESLSRSIPPRRLSRSTEHLARSVGPQSTVQAPLTGSWTSPPPIPPPVSLHSYRRHSVSQPLTSRAPLHNTDSSQQGRQLQQATLTIDEMRERLRMAEKSNEECKKQFRASTEELTRRLQDTLLERDRLAASRISDATNQEVLVNTLENAVTELHRTTDSQQRTIEDTERQLHILQLIKSDHDNTVDLLRTVLKGCERRAGKPYYVSEPINSQSSAMLVHTLERCIEQGEREREVQADTISQLESQIADLQTGLQEVEKTTTRSAEERLTRMREDLESRLQAADERAANARSQSDSLKQQLEIVQEQYKGSELLREEQNRMLEERVEMLKSHLEGERKDSNSKLESVSVALDSTNRDLTNVLSTKDELVRKYAGLEEKVKDSELVIEKLTAELEAEREQAKKVWEKDNEILNRNVEIETKMALRDAEMARLEALLEKTKNECAKKINQEVQLAEKYQSDKFGEEKTILVKQVDSLNDRVSTLTKDLQETQVENGKLLSQLKHTLDKLKEVERLQTDTSDDKVSLQSQLIAKNGVLDKVTRERDQYLNMLEQRNNQFNDISIACERVNMQRDERERHVATLESTIAKLEERLTQAHKELNGYQQENTTLHRTREEFDGRIREMEAAVDKQTKKLKSKDKKIADADSERERMQEMLAHKEDTLSQLEEQLRGSEAEVRECRREISLLAEECNALKSVIKGQEGEMQREINNLLIKMKAVEHDYRLAKKALKSKEHADKQASQVADSLQVELTEQRKYSDDLRSKLRWMEESLESARKDKQGVEDRCEQLQVELEHRCKAEQRQQQIVMTERSKASMLQSKVVSLEDGLKETITRCSALQAAAEKSEQDIYKLKLQHQLELKELQRSGEQRDTLVMSAPISPPRQQYDGVASELKTVLKDMKDLLSTAQHRGVYGKASTRSGKSDCSVLSQSDGGRGEPAFSEYSSVDLHKLSSGSVDSLLRPPDGTGEKRRRHKESKHRKVSEPLKTEAQALCKNLERKLDQLSKLGQEAVEDSRTFTGKQRSSTTSAEKLHRYLRSQKTS